MSRVIALLSLLLIPSLASASTMYDAHAYRADGHAMWIPDVARDLVFDPHGSFAVSDDEWSLEGELVSRSNPRLRFALQVSFTGVVTGDEFRTLTGASDSRIKGADWSDQKDDWMFAEHVNGRITHSSGRAADFVRYAGTNDYWAQLGSGLNDKNDLFGLSTWVTLYPRGYTHALRGDLNLNLSSRPSQAVPEPSAALIFGAGLIVMSRVRRRSA